MELLHFLRPRRYKSVELSRYIGRKMLQGWHFFCQKAVLTWIEHVEKLQKAVIEAEYTSFVSFLSLFLNFLQLYSQVDNDIGYYGDFVACGHVLHIT